MLIASIIISSLSIVILGVILFILIKRKPVNSNEGISEKDLGALQAQINSLKETLQKDIELSIAKEMIKLTENASTSSEKNNEKLERFQKNIIESLNTRFEFINNQLSQKMTDINKKVEDKLKEGFQGTSETMAQVRERLKVIDEAQKNMENLSKDVIS